MCRGVGSAPYSTAYQSHIKHMLALKYLKLYQI